jgi:hypothetical protein
LYHLGIYSAAKGGLIQSFASNSLRETVRLAGVYVAEMDGYQKVIRELARCPGAYASSFRLLDKKQSCMVLILGLDEVGSDFTFPKILGAPAGSPSGSSS